MADIFFKPSHEDLADERKKALKGTTEEEWCNRCVNTLVRILRKDPVAYRQYGPYWWNLKKSVISRQPEAIHGDFIDDLWAERTDYGDEVDNILSAILYAQQFIEEHIYPSLGAKTPQTRSKSGFAGFFNFFLIGGKLTLSHFPMARPYLRGTSHARRKSTQCPEASERRVSF